MIALVALDMAGTTIDDGGAVYRMLQRSVEEAGATVAADDLQKWMGTDKVEAITNLLRLGGVEPASDLVASTFDAFRAHLHQAYLDEPPVALPGVVDTIAELRSRGIKVALTTGFSDDVVAPLLDSLGWTAGDGPDHTVDAVITTSAVPAGRPAPYMIFRAMEACDAHDVRSVLVAGDTAVDVRSGRNAGAVAVGVLTGEVDRAALAAEDHDYILDSVADIPSVLGQC